MIPRLAARQLPRDSGATFPRQRGGGQLRLSFSPPMVVGAVCPSVPYLEVIDAEVLPQPSSHASRQTQRGPSTPPVGK